MRNGASLTTTDGQAISLQANAAAKVDADISGQQLPLRAGTQEGMQQETECPPTITCRFVPARFAQNDPVNPADYGNYDKANRPADMKVKYIIIHDTEGSYEESISWFQDPRSFVAAHYVIRSADGEVTQMVKNKDMGWQAGNWY